MISDEVKQAIRDTVYAFTHERVDADGDDFVKAVEKRLSPKHPPKGAPCEVWDDNQRPHFLAAYLRRADGNGAFHFVGRGEEDKSRRWDHYREIPTATDALDVLQGIIDERDSNGADVDHTQGIYFARQAIMTIVDNAKEG